MSPKVLQKGIDAEGNRERRREKELNELSIAASGYTVIITRSVFAAAVDDDDDDDEREKLKRISSNCRPLVRSLGSGVVCHR